MARYAIRAGLKQSGNEFVNSYGSYADKYSLVRPNGNQVTSVFLWILISAFIIGALFAFINTNLSEQEHIYVSIHYFFAHGLVIFVMLSIVLDGYRPVWKDYFNTIKWTTILVVIIIIINLLLGSNYMFTFEKPAGVNFTLLMPDWPYYYLIMLFIGLSFYTVMMAVSHFLTKKT